MSSITPEVCVYVGAVTVAAPLADADADADGVGTVNVS